MTGRESIGESSATDAAALLTALADVLNKCTDAGIKVKFKHGAAYTRAGYILPVENDRWVARTLLYTELAPPDDEDD